MLQARLFAIATAFSLAAGSSFAGPGASRTQTRDQSVSTHYQQSSVDGCETLSVEVFASNRMTRTNETKTFVPRLTALVFSFNFCTQVFTAATGTSDGPAIDIRQDLTRATVSGVVSLTVEGSPGRTLQVDLTWSGGELSTEREMNFFTSPFSRTRFQTNGSFRNSASVNGSLVLDGMDLLGNANPAQDRDITGIVSSAKSASFEFSRTR